MQAFCASSIEQPCDNLHHLRLFLKVRALFTNFNCSATLHTGGKRDFAAMRAIVMS